MNITAYKFQKMFSSSLSDRVSASRIHKHRGKVNNKNITRNTVNIWTNDLNTHFSISQKNQKTIW